MTQKNTKKGKINEDLNRYFNDNYSKKGPVQKNTIRETILNKVLAKHKYSTEDDEDLAGMDLVSVPLSEVEEIVSETIDETVHNYTTGIIKKVYGEHAGNGHSPEELSALKEFCRDLKKRAKKYGIISPIRK